MKISLVIPAHNEENYIGTCLESVRMSGTGLFEIIVVDNASTDKTEDIAKKFQNVRVVKEPSKGLTKARERGFKEARGDIVAYIDADTKIRNQWVEKILQLFKENPDAVCVSGPYVYYDLSLLGRIAVWIYFAILVQPAYFFTGYMAMGGNFAVRKNALFKVGGFDKNISFYGEDTDIARRLHTIGKVIFSRQLYVYTSARRFKGEGILTTAWRYIINFLSVVILKKPVTHNYTDIR